MDFILLWFCKIYIQTNQKKFFTIYFSSHFSLLQFGMDTKHLCTLKLSERLKMVQKLTHVLGLLVSVH